MASPVYWSGRGGRREVGGGGGRREVEGGGGEESHILIYFLSNLLANIDS